MTIEIFLLGYTGNVGRSLLAIAERAPAALELRIAGVANTRGAWRLGEPVKIAALNSALDAAVATTLDDALGDWTASSGNRCFVDCSASADVASRYPSLLDAAVAIVTPNKRAFSAAHADFTRLQQLSLRSGAALCFEATVGAALPVLQTLAGLRACGDRLLSIEASLSGTLAYVLDRLHAGRRLSDAVAEARKLGLTEPDPWADLSGMDVARKLVILARVGGYPLELEDIQVTPLLERSAALSKFEDFDTLWGERIAQAQARGERIVYSARFDGSQAQVGPLALPADHPLAQGRGRDNVIALSTQLYSPEPLVVRGPGAGAELTATAVLSEILALRARQT